MEVVIALLSAMIGLFVGQANNYFERRYNRRKALKKILSDLLFVRNHLVWNFYYSRNLAERMPVIPQERGKYVAELIDQTPYIDDRIIQRYDDAVGILAEYFPINAAELRSKVSTAMLLIKNQRNMYWHAEHPMILSYAIANSQMVEKQIIPVLDLSLQRLARTIGSRHYRNVKEIIEEKIEEDQERNQLINSVIDGLSELNSKVFEKKSDLSLSVVSPAETESVAEDSGRNFEKKT